MNCACGKPAAYKGTQECRACYRRRRYHEDAEFRERARKHSYASRARRESKERRELEELRAMHRAVKLCVEYAEMPESLRGVLRSYLPTRKEI